MSVRLGVGLKVIRRDPRAARRRRPHVALLPRCPDPRQMSFRCSPAISPETAWIALQFYARFQFEFLLHRAQYLLSRVWLATIDFAASHLQQKIRRAAISASWMSDFSMRRIVLHAIFVIRVEIVWVELVVRWSNTVIFGVFFLIFHKINFFLLNFCGEACARIFPYL